MTIAISGMTAAPSGAASTDLFEISRPGAPSVTYSVTAANILRAAADGTALLPTIGPSSDPDTGMYSVGANSLGISTGGVLGLSLAVQTSGAGANLAITDSVRTGGAGVSQIGTKWSYTLNQTSTAAFTALDLAITETAVGSGAQYLINAKTGAGGATQVFAVTRVGQVLATGPVGTPALSFAAFPTDGIYSITTTQIGVALAGVSRYQFGISDMFFMTSNHRIGSGLANDALRLSGLYGAVANGPLYVLNSNAFTASTAVQQMAFRIYSGVNQTSTAGFASLYINQTLSSDGITGTPVFGSAGGFQIDCYVAGARRFSVRDNGGIANAATTVTLGAGSTDNSTALGSYGVIEVTSNGAGSTLTGIVAPLDERYLLIRHVAGLTLTLTHQTVSTAANQFFNGSGATTIVLGIGGQAWYRYSLSAARWCLISYTL